MKCKNCKRVIDDDSIFCKWCGERQIRERKKKDEIKVPSPTQLPSGMWRIQLRQEKQSITEKTPELCTAKAIAIRAGFLEVKKQSVEKGLTLRTAIDRYIDRRQNSLSPTTIRAYRIVQKNRFQSVADLTLHNGIDWQKVCDNEAPLCKYKTLKNAWLFVGSVLRENGLDVPKVKLPQQEIHERKWLDPDQILTFCDACRGSRIETESLLALMSLRRSELLALRWKDVDLPHHCFTINQVLVPNEHNKYVIKNSAKSKTSARTVPILIPRLEELLVKPADAAHDDLISHTAPNSLIRSINRICADAGLPEVGVHGLRHSFASLAYHLGYREEECMRIGGWSDYTVMHDVYTHLYQKDIEAKQDKMYQFYENRGKEKSADPDETSAPS